MSTPDHNSSPRFDDESSRSATSASGNFKGQFVPFAPTATVATKVAADLAAKTSKKRTTATGMVHFPFVTYARFETPFAPSYKVIRAHQEVIDTTVEPEGDEADSTVQMSITVPNTAKVNSDLPVVVMIHGGGYQYGRRNEPWFSGSGFAQNDIITVSLSYRLGLRGFVPFANEDPNHYRGIDDCQNALEWIQKHIEEFGGDPTNVTLMGQSAGAGIALWLARRDHYRGTFRRVWAMSPGYPRNHFLKRRRRLRSILSTPITKTRLEALKPSKLEKGEQRFSKTMLNDLAFGPSPYDATELTALPIVVSSTREEFFNFGPALKLDSSRWSGPMRTLLLKVFGGKNYVPVGAKDSSGERYFGQLITDSFFRRLVEQTARLSDGRVWAIEYAGTPQQPVHHCADIPWVMGCTEEIAGSKWEFFKDPSESMLAEIHSHAVRFARGDKPSWKNYAQNQSVLTLFPNGEVSSAVTNGDGSKPEKLNDHAALVRDPFKNVRQAFPIRKY